MEFKAGDIALMLQGTVEGNTEVKVWKLARIEEGEPGALSFLPILNTLPIFTTPPLL